MAIIVHPWKEQVVGGIGGPIFLLLEDNLLTNSRFTDNDDTGWYWDGANLTSPKTIIEDDAYEEYMGRLNYSDTEMGFGFHNAAVGHSQYKMYLLSLRIKCIESADWDVAIGIHGSSSASASGTLLAARTVTLNTKIKKVWMIVYNVGSDYDYIGARIYGSVVENAGADVRFDDVGLYQLVGAYGLPVPLREKMKFNKIVSGENILYDGKIQEFNKRWRPEYIAEWDFLNKENEKYRQRIAECDNIFTVPHGDFGWGFFSKWKDDYERNYAFNKFVGHAGRVHMIGTEVMQGTMHPQDIFWDEGTGNPDIECYIQSTGAAAGVVEIEYRLVEPNVDGDIWESDDTPFTMTGQQGCRIDLRAPSTAGVGKVFSRWEDNFGHIIHPDRTILNHLMINQEFLIAIYEDPSEGKSGYGMNGEYSFDATP